MEAGAILGVTAGDLGFETGVEEVSTSESESQEGVSGRDDAPVGYRR